VRDGVAPVAVLGTDPIDIRNAGEEEIRIFFDESDGSSFGQSFVRDRGLSAGHDDDAFTEPPE
jgi:hypothetical protein